jgi:peroxiredoxin Q/BCP
MADGKLAPGDRAPTFTLLDQHGEKLALTSFKGRKVMIYFYPKALTPGCTTQSCLLRDMSSEIGDTAILGISPDEPDRQKRFDDEHSLGFPLLSDPDHKVAEKYGVWGEKKNYGRSYMGIIRSAFLVTETGRLSHAWYKISPKATPTKLQQALAK